MAPLLSLFTNLRSGVDPQLLFLKDHLCSSLLSMDQPYTQANSGPMKVVSAPLLGPYRRVHFPKNLVSRYNTHSGNVWKHLHSSFNVIGLEPIPLSD